MLYFAYGSNMNLARMKSRKTDFEFRTAARLEGYELKFNKKAGFTRTSYSGTMYPASAKMKIKKTLYQSPKLYATTGIKKKVSQAEPEEGYANVMKNKDSIVEGALYVVPEDGIKKLDTHEGYPTHYDRQILKIKCANGMEAEAIVYIAKADKVAENLLPTDTYLAHLLKGVDVLSDDYFQALVKQETISEFSNSGYGSSWKNESFSTNRSANTGASSTGNANIDDYYESDDYWEREEELAMAEQRGWIG